MAVAPNSQILSCGNCSHNAKGKALGCSRLWGEVSWKLQHLSILLLVKYSWLSFTSPCSVEHSYFQLYKQMKVRFV